MPDSFNCTPKGTVCENEKWNNRSVGVSGPIQLTDTPKFTDFQKTTYLCTTKAGDLHITLKIL